MKTELQVYAEVFEAEVVAFNTLPNYEFIKKYIDSSFENDGDIFASISEYFSCLEIQAYYGSNGNIYEILLGYGGPNVYLIVNSRWRTVEYEISWGGESYSKELNYLYNAFEEIYSLDAYEQNASD